MAKQFLGRDWRSPGDQWVHTASGWKRLLDTSTDDCERTEKDATSTDRASVRGLPHYVGVVEDWRPVIDDDDTYSGDSCQPKNTGSHEPAVHRGAMVHIKKPSSELREDQLYHRCVSALQGSRECSHYSTLSDAVQKLNFLHALYDEHCFPFICKVVGLLYEHCYSTLSGTTQNALLKICERAKNTAVHERNHIDVVLCMVNKAVTTLKRSFSSEESVHLKRTINLKLQALEKISIQVQHTMDGFQSGADLSELPQDCLRLVISHLSHPIDIISLGRSCQKIYLLAQENWVWKGLMHYHFGQQSVEEALLQHEALLDYGYDTYVSWKDIFITNYQLSRERFRRHSYRDVLLLCSACNYVFWKKYGHPCTFGTQASFQTIASEDFLKFFVW